MEPGTSIRNRGPLTPCSQAKLCHLRNHFAFGLDSVLHQIRPPCELQVELESIGIAPFTWPLATVKAHLKQIHLKLGNGRVLVQARVPLRVLENAFSLRPLCVLVALLALYCCVALGAWRARPCAAYSRP